MFIPIAKERIPEEWDRIRPLIEPSMVYDQNTTPDEVRGWLETGRSEAFWIAIYPNAKGIGVTTIIEAGEEKVCFIEYVGGTVSGGPRLFVKTAKIIVHDIEDLARQAGCTELRGGGRNWARIFPDWERFDPAHPNRMRKRIANNG